jgi:cell division protein FtsA
VDVDELVLAVVGAGDAVLTDTEREMGVILADVGAGTVDLGIFINGAVWHTVVLGVGGDHITNDVAIGLRLPPAIAERVKLEYGHARPNQVSPDERFTVSPFGDGRPQVVPRWRLAEIVEARAEEMLLMIRDEIKRSGYDGLLPAGVVLCGGAALMPGIQELSEDILALSVRVGVPTGLKGLVDAVSSPAHAVGAGLMGWGGTVDTRPQFRRSGPGAGARIVEWLRAFLPG